METKPGTQTSEFKLALVVTIIGTILEAFAGVLHTLQGAGHSAPWMPAVLGIIGALLQVASLFGYTKSRTLVKIAELQAPASAPAETSPK